MNLQYRRRVLFIMAILILSIIAALFPASGAKAVESDGRPPVIIMSCMPEADSIKTGDKLLITVYFYEETGIVRANFDGLNPLTETSNPKAVIDGKNLWHVDLEFTENGQKTPGFQAYDATSQMPSIAYAQTINCFSDSPDYSKTIPMLSLDDLIFLDEEGNEYSYGMSVPSPAYVTVDYELQSEESWKFYHIVDVFSDRSEVGSEVINGRQCYPVTAGYYQFSLYRGEKFIRHIIFAFHDWTEPEFTWDGLETVTGTTQSTLEPDKTITETATVTSEVTKEPSCVEKGETTYTAEFENVVFPAQSKTIDNLDPLGHDYAAPTYEWDTQYAYVTATRVCSRDAAHTETEVGVSTSVVIKQPTCEERGTVVYTASFVNEAFATQTVTKDTLDPLGHSWGQIKYEWAADNSTVTASAVCGNNSSHTLTETAKTTKTQLTEPTCTEEGEDLLTVNFINLEFTYQSKFITLPALGHMYGEATYTWSSDNTTVTATRICTRDANHAETEVAEVTKKVTKEPTATEDGVMTLTAVFKNGAFVTQTKTEVIPKLGNGTYRLVSGGNETYTLGTNTSLQFIYSRSTDDETSIYHFQGIKIDDLTVDSVYYVVRSGSVILDVSGVYLETLSTGEHTLIAMFDDGEDVKATFTITSASGTVVTYKVIFNANGHGDWPDTQTVQSGKTVTRPTDPKADGYVFGGWYIDSACTVAFNFNNPITQNTTLYAKWTMNGASGGGSGTDGSGTGGNTDNPATGDNSNMMLWAVLLLVSLSGMAAMLLSMNRQRAIRRK